MSTRMSNDIGRIMKDNEIKTFEGRYHLNTPGVDLKYSDDPNIRLQKFGGNMTTNMLGVEEILMCRTKRAGRDYLDNDYRNDKILGRKRIEYGNVEESYNVRESRSELPVWCFREKDQQYSRFENLWINPQENIERDFHHNIQTRLMEKERIE